MLPGANKIKFPKFRSTKVETPNFLLKLYNILEATENQDVIHWDNTGQNIVMKNLKVFTEKILPFNYKHKNYSSFVRQLNMYDFHKKRNSNNEEMFFHTLFNKTQKHLISSIKRKTRKRREVLDNAPSSQYDNETGDKKVTKASIENTISDLTLKMKSNIERQHSFENKVDILSNEAEDNLHQNRQLLKDFVSKSEYKNKLEAMIIFLIEVFLQKPHMKTDTIERKNSDIVSSALMKEMTMTDSSMYSTLLNFKHNNLDIFNQLISKNIKNNRRNINDYLLLSPKQKSIAPTKLFTCSPINSKIINEDSLLSSSDDFTANKAYSTNHHHKLSTMNQTTGFDSSHTLSNMNMNINRIGEDYSNISINSKNFFDCDYDDVIVNSIISDHHMLIPKKNNEMIRNDSLE